MQEGQVFLVVLTYGLFMFWFGFKTHKELIKTKKKGKK